MAAGVADDEDCEDVGKALRETFGPAEGDGEGVEPAATMISGARFVSLEMKVEIEADAVVV